MAQQLKLYGRQEMTKVMKRSRDDFENEKAGEILQSRKFQARALAKKGYSVSLIARILKLKYNTVVKYLIEK